MQGVLVLMSAFHQSVYNGLTEPAQREAWKIQTAHSEQTAAEDSQEPADSSNSIEASNGTKPNKSNSIEPSNGTKPDPSNSIEPSNGNKPDPSNSIEASNGTKPDPSSNPVDSFTSDSEELREIDSPSFHGYYLCNACYAPLVFSSLGRVLHGETLRLVTAQCCVYVLRFLLSNHIYGDLLPSSLVQDLASLFPLFHVSPL